MFFFRVTVVRRFCERSLSLIYELINVTTKKTDHEQEALHAHLDTALLKELACLLESHEIHVNGNTAAIESLQQKMNEQSQKVVPGHNAVNGLGENMCLRIYN